MSESTTIPEEQTPANLFFAVMRDHQSNLEVILVNEGKTKAMDVKVTTRTLSDMKTGQGKVPHVVDRGEPHHSELSGEDGALSSTLGNGVVRGRRRKSGSEGNTLPRTGVAQLGSASAQVRPLRHDERLRVQLASGLAILTRSATETPMARLHVATTKEDLKTNLSSPPGTIPTRISVCSKVLRY